MKTAYVPKSNGIFLALMVLKETVQKQSSKHFQKSKKLPYADVFQNRCS